MNENEKYNGWTNWETWLVALHLSNNYATQKELEEEAKTHDKYELANYIEYITDIYEHDDIDLLKYKTDYSLMIQDIVTHALGRVNYIEIAETYYED